MTKIIIETEDAKELAQQGGLLVFKKEAELALVELYKMKDMIERQIEIAKTSIAEAGTMIDPNFRGVVGENIKAIYRVFGEKYTYDENFLTLLLNAGFLKETKRYKVDSKKVDEYFEKKALLPEGVQIKDRQKVISLVMPKNEEDATELQPVIALDDGEK